MADSQPTCAEHVPQLTDDYREIAGFPGYYLKSDGTAWTRWKLVAARGTFVSVETGNLSRHFTSRNRFGYHLLRIKRRGMGQMQMVLSKAMLLAFVGPPPSPGMCACHNDGDKENNKISNLRWDTRSGNERDKVLHGTSNRGERNGKALLSADTVRLIRRMFDESPMSKAGKFRAAGTIKKISEATGVSAGSVQAIAYRQSWKHVE